MSKIYTKTGDLGETSLLGGARVSKSDVRIEAYGEVDELNATIGLACGLWRKAIKESGGGPHVDQALKALGNIQNELFVIGSRLACGDEKFLGQLPILDEVFIKHQENLMDDLNQLMPKITKFILPSGSPVASAFHLARTVCRRAERSVLEVQSTPKIEPLIIKYLNRTSDCMFVVARFVNFSQNEEEVYWEPVR